MDEYSPWGSSDSDPLPLPVPRPPSPLPSFGSTSLNAAAPSSWGDDGGGWGTTTDDYGSTGFGGGSSTINDEFGVEVTTEDLEDRVLVGDEGEQRLGTTSAWEPNESVATTNAVEVEPTPPRSPSPPGFAPSPPLSPINVSLSPSSTPPPPEAAPPSDQAEEEEEDDWGGHGQSPVLPPISSLNLSTQPDSPIETRDSGWGRDDDGDGWQPPEIPSGLPSLKDLGLKEAEESRRRSVDDGEEEGWGGASGGGVGGRREVPEWKLGDEDEVGREGEGEGGAGWEGESKRGKSIPAALVDGLKVDSREFAHSTWPVKEESWGPGGFQEQSSGVSPLLTSLLEPPTLPPSSTITNDTPLPLLFKLTPTLYPNFNEGISKTAMRTAETLKGTSSAAYRNARFGIRNSSTTTGRTSIEGGSSSPAERGHAGDEFDLDGPGAEKPKSSWWGSRGGGEAANATTTTTKKKDDLSILDEPARSASPDPAPSAIGRFFGRLKRPTSATNSQDGSTSPRTSGDFGDDPAWAPKDLDAVHNNNNSKFAQAKYEGNQINDDLSDFFGDSSATRPTTRIASAPPEDDFGGLLSNFSQAPKKPIGSSNSKKSRVYDPFDPFADDEEEESVAAPSFVPTSTTTTSPGPTRRVISPPLIPSRPLTPQSPQRSNNNPPPSITSFPSPLAAPQARAPSHITHQGQVDPNDSFDDFFDSFATKPPPPPPTSTTTTIGARPFSVPPPSILPRTSTQPPPRLSTLSPPIRSSTISPPGSSSSSASPLSALAPPPPPSQPLNQRGFGIAPPPPSASPVGGGRVGTPVTSQAPTIPIVPPSKPKPNTTGSLSKDDFAFFES